LPTSGEQTQLAAALMMAQAQMFDDLQAQKSTLPATPEPNFEARRLMYNEA
jgi:hypothetical protein